MNQSAEQPLREDMNSRRDELRAAIGDAAASIRGNLETRAVSSSSPAERRPSVKAETPERTRDLETQARGLLADVYSEEELADAA